MTPLPQSPAVIVNSPLCFSLLLPLSVVLHVSFIHMPMCVLSCSVMSDSLWPMDYSLPGPLPMAFSGQEYWSGLPCPPPGDLPDLRIELASFMSPALAGKFFTTSTTWEALICPHTHTHTHLLNISCVIEFISVLIHYLTNESAFIKDC